MITALESTTILYWKIMLILFLQFMKYVEYRKRDMGKHDNFTTLDAIMHHRRVLLQHV